VTEWRVDAFAGRQWEPVGWWPTKPAAETFIRDLACLPCRIEKEGGMALFTLPAWLVAARKFMGTLTDWLNKGRSVGAWMRGKGPGEF
jgi:hypothetical protein